MPRLGGGYGGKASRASQIACACALVAYKLNRKASLVMPLTDNMEAIGKRQAAYFEYEVRTDTTDTTDTPNSSIISIYGHGSRVSLIIIQTLLTFEYKN